MEGELAAPGSKRSTDLERRGAPDFPAPKAKRRGRLTVLDPGFEAPDINGSTLEGTLCGLDRVY
jgi:hypothetical protein